MGDSRLASASKAIVSEKASVHDITPLDFGSQNSSNRKFSPVKLHPRVPEISMNQLNDDASSSIYNK